MIVNCTAGSLGDFNAQDFIAGVGQADMQARSDGAAVRSGVVEAGREDVVGVGEAAPADLQTLHLVALVGHRDEIRHRSFDHLERPLQGRGAGLMLAQDGEEANQRPADSKQQEKQAEGLRVQSPSRQFDSKRIGTHGLLQDREGRLLVSMRNATGEIRNVQRIYPDGRKFYLKGPTHGLWHNIGQAFNGSPIAIVEGFSTGATIHEAAGFPVAVAFSSGNLLAVAQETRRLYPRSPIIVCGDDDWTLPLRPIPLPNVGRENAIEAAEAVGGEAVFPVFAEGDYGTDWNDAGFNATRAQLTALMKANRPIGLLQPTC